MKMPAGRAFGVFWQNWENVKTKENIIQTKTTKLLKSGALS
jgi:hypothetical protein